jgi:DNA polymerase V
VEGSQKLLEATASYAPKCAFKLRKQSNCANGLSVFIHTNRFADTLPYANSIRLVLPTAKGSDLDLIKYSRQTLEAIY